MITELTIVSTTMAAASLRYVVRVTEPGFYIPPPPAPASL